jgi:hypothetical protein
MAQSGLAIPAQTSPLACHLGTVLKLPRSISSTFHQPLSVFVATVFYPMIFTANDRKKVNRRFASQYRYWPPYFFQRRLGKNAD